MKYTVSLAVIALLQASAMGAKQEKSLSQIAQEQDDIDSGNSKWSQNLGPIDGKTLLTQVDKKADQSKENLSKAVDQAKSDIKDNKPVDKKFIQTKIEEQIKKPEEKNGEPFEGKHQSGIDIYSQDNNRDGRETDRVGEWMKNYEDTYQQGRTENSLRTGTTDQNFNNQHHILPNSWQTVAPVNQPKHLNPGEYTKAGSYIEYEGTVGITQMFVFMDTEEHARRFTKDLFKNKLCSAVSIEGTSNRSYLKFGEPVTETGRSKLTIHLPNEKVNALIDYVNDNDPSLYDYPVPDIYALPIKGGNPEYISWVQTQGTSNAGLNQTYV